MHTVKVDKTQLLEKLDGNLQRHRQDYAEAFDGYRERVVTELDKAANEARSGGEVRTYIDLEAPHNHTNEYEKAIAMLNMSVDQVIELDAHQFNCYVLDQWEWKKHAMTVASQYVAKKVLPRNLGG